MISMVFSGGLLWLHCCNDEIDREAMVGSRDR